MCLRNYISLLGLCCACIAGTASQAETETPEKKRAGQLDLFTTQADPVLKELLGLDIMSMTPLEALNTLSEMKKKLSEKSKGKDKE